MKNIITAALVLTAILWQSCEKEEGEGGTSSIKGTIITRDFNGSFPVQDYSDYGAPEEDVYIIYGSEGNAIGDRVRTSFDGTFEFKYLRKGVYTIFVYSEDTNLVAPVPSGKVVIKQTVEITKNKSTVTAPTITRVEL
ncbi:MAG: hypothetical protein JNK61_00565 [Bacteroidia bacterium]|nr:hypothetical protein [Bacteroidia bacterium]HQU99872.1 hypothetical protein [Bacteroidia bacterium]